MAWLPPFFQCSVSPPPPSYDKGVTKRVVSAWFATPSFAGVTAFVVFSVVSGIF